MKEIKIRSFENKDATDYAKFLHSCESLFPEGSRSGVILSDNEILEDYLTTNVIRRNLALVDGQIIGANDIINGFDGTVFLNKILIHPKFQNSRVFLNLYSTTWSFIYSQMINQKFKRLITQTWDSNRLALKVYKKVGFYTGIKGDLVNYLITVCSNQNFDDFVKKSHYSIEEMPVLISKWCSSRSLNNYLAKNEEFINKFDLFGYFFENDNYCYGGLIDPISEEFTLLENEIILVKCEIERQKIFADFEYNIKWEIYNKSKNHIELNLHVNHSPNIFLSIKENSTCSVQAEKSNSINGKIKVANFVNSTEIIESIFQFDNLNLILKTGFYILEPIDISFSKKFNFKLDKPGEEFIYIHNKTENTISGKIQLNPVESFISLKPGSKTFRAAADEKLQIPFLFDVNKNGIFLIKLVLEIDELSYTCEKEAYIIYPKVGEVGFSESNSEILIINDSNIFLIYPNDFKTIIVDRKTNKPISLQNFGEISPPYVYLKSEILFKGFEYKLSIYEGKVHLRIEASSVFYEGLIIVKKIVIHPSAIVEVNYDIINKSNKIYEDIELYYKNNFFDENSDLAIPVKNKIFISPFIKNEYPDDKFFDLPRNQKFYSEKWSCFYNSELAFGIIWQEVDEIIFGDNKLPHLKYVIKSIKPGQKIKTKTSYFYNNTGNWKGLRQYYYNLNNLKNYYPLPSVIYRNFYLNWENEGIVIINSIEKINLIIKSIRKKITYGKISFKCPGEIEIDKDFIDFNVSNDKEHKSNLMFKVKEKCNFKILGLKTNLKTDNLNEKIIIPIVLYNNNNKIETEVTNSEKLKLSNGRLNAKIDSSFGGCIYKISDIETNKDYLQSSYPEESTFFMHYPWSGGLFSNLSFKTDEKVDLFNINLEKGFNIDFDKVSKHKIKYNKLTWSGISLQKKLKDLFYEIEYLTLPYSGILMINTSIHNKSKRSLRLNNKLACFINNSLSKNLTLNYKRNESWKTWINSGDPVQILFDNNALISFYDSLFLIMFSDCQKSQMYINDYGKLGLHFLQNTNFTLASNKIINIRTYLSYSNNKDEVQNINNFFETQTLGYD